MDNAKDPYTLNVTKDISGIKGTFYGELVPADGTQSILLITRIPAYAKYEKKVETRTN